MSSHKLHAIFGGGISVVFFLSAFTNWFAVNQWLRLSIVALLVFNLLSVLFFINKKIIISIPEFVATQILYFFIVFSSTINVEYFNAKSLNHILAMTFIVFFMFFFPSFILRNYARYNAVFVALGYGLVFCAFSFPVILFVDFILVNVFGFKMADLFVWASVGNADYFIWSGYLFSVAGPAEEPAVSAYYSLLFFFSAIAFCSFFKIHKILPWLYAFQVLALVSTMSSTAILVFVLYCAQRIVTGGQWAKTKIIIILIFPIGLVFAGRELLSILETFDFIQKITLSDSSGSVGVRLHSWQLFFDKFLSSFWFGMGPGYNNILVGTGVHSTFFTILLNYGVFSLSALLILLYIVFLEFRRLDMGWVFFITLIPHFIGDYYFSSLYWLFLCYICAISSTQTVRRRGLF